jgi:hypothetical protein
MKIRRWRGKDQNNQEPRLATESKLAAANFIQVFDGCGANDFILVPSAGGF